MTLLNFVFSSPWVFLGCLLFYVLALQLILKIAGLFSITLVKHKNAVVVDEQENKWRIWSIEHSGWWKANGNGYTTNRAEAGLYTYSNACEIVRGANRSLDFNGHLKPNEAMVLADKE